MLKKLTCILIFSISIWSTLSSQEQEEIVIGINDAFTDKELVEDVFLKGFCSNVSNIEATGDFSSLGNFFNGETIIGIKSGIIIATGQIQNAEGPNDEPDTTGGIGTTGDDDLSKLVTQSIFDVSGITFDFVPLTNRVSFTYVFASEEYCEFVDSPFNDVFGFFVSGPGINGQFSRDAINVALIPGSNEFVSINTINHKLNQDLYISNELESDADLCDIGFSPEKVANIEYDGFTIPLKAEFDVIPCETYTIRLVVADVNDGAFDSAVFLEMNSFDIGGNVRVSATSESGQDTIISEGCTNGVFKFERIDTDISREQSYDLVVTESSTARIGTDVEDIDLSITFGAGDSVVYLPITLIDDNNLEDLETFGLGIAGECPCSNGGSAELVISDQMLFDADLDGYFACAGEEFELIPNVIGGAPPYRYAWEDGSEEEALITTLTEPKTFNVTVTDFCNRKTTTSALVDIQTNPTAKIDGEYTFCSGVDRFIDIELEGTPPWDLSYQLNTESVVEVKDILAQPFRIPANQEGEIKLINFNDRTCSGLVEGVATLIPEEIEIEVFKTEPACANTYDGSISFDVLSGSTITDITWTPDALSNYEGSELLAGDYRLKVTDERGCMLNEVINLSGNPDSPDCGDLLIYIPNVFSPNGDRLEDRFIIHLEHDPQIQSVESFSIFDRWGNKVFQKLDFGIEVKDIGFDASYIDSDIMPSVLSYVSVLNLNGGDKRSVSGTITVIR